MNQSNRIRLATLITVLTFPFWLIGYLISSVYQIIKVNVITVTTLTKHLVILPNTIILSFAQNINRTCTKEKDLDNEL